MGCSLQLIISLEIFDLELCCSGLCGSSCEIMGFWCNVEGDDVDWFVNSGLIFILVGIGFLDDIIGGGNYVYFEVNGL